MSATFSRLNSPGMRVALGVVAAVMISGGVVYGIYGLPITSSAKSVREQNSSSMDGEPGLTIRLPPPDLFRPLTPEQAMKANADRAFSTRSDSPAVPFRLRADEITRERALECLTEAIYYEAANEGAAGQRAVAQVVLNRLRHPAYPASVCGVVYQGSERVTGCQFTFTCDGALRRIPIRARWKEAAEVARQALGGSVFGPVGHATHYHADYVLPYWADSLDKAIKVGRHIFYRFKGSLGSSNAFSQRHRGAEPLPPPPTTLELPTDLPNEEELVAKDPADLREISSELLVSSAPPQTPVADTTAGSLIRDETVFERNVTRSTDSPAKSSCRPANQNSRMKPLGTAKMRPQDAASC